MVNKKKTKLGISSLLFSSSSRDKSTTSVLPYSSSSCSNMSSSSSAVAWQWPSCKQPRTLSFRQQQTMMKTMNSAYSADFSTNSFASRDSHSLSSTCRSRTPSDASASADAVTRALRSDRLFFDPDASPAADSSSSAVLKLNKTKAKKKKKKVDVLGGATAMSIESSNPYRDFRESMEAMVTSGGGRKVLDDWRWLEEMLGWYLRANVKSTHGLIVGAFVDLLISAAASPSPSPASSSSSPAAAKYSSCCSDCSSSSIKEQEHQLHHHIINNS
uniref:Transcription repressor n=1 Tax=Oryza punctata TaxID=4537 RepID=A0A0E0LQB0_ORYPU